MTRLFYLLFGVSAYFIFFASFLYLIAFVGDAPWVPFTINRGGADIGLFPAIVIDLGLVLLFGVQHSAMARPGFKKRWTRIVPQALERSIYVLIASLVLVLLFRFWVPIPGTVWNAGDSGAATAILGLFGVGWLTVLASTFLLNHFELFGLKQVWDYAQGNDAAEPLFRTPLFYKLVRHPIYSGFVLAFWAIPHMTIGHLLFAISMTIYILIAIGHEERDLIAEFGSRYEDYRKRVGGLFPRLTR